MDMMAGHARHLSSHSKMAFCLGSLGSFSDVTDLGQWRPPAGKGRGKASIDTFLVMKCFTYMKRVYIM